jgi:hypothetical protein
MMHANVAAGADRIGPITASARWERQADIPNDVLFPAIEAALEGGRPETEGE